MRYRDLNLRNDCISAVKREVPSKILHEAEAAVSELLPQKSKYLYEKEFCAFEKWKAEMNVIGNMKKVVLAYFHTKSNVTPRVVGLKDFSFLVYPIHEDFHGRCPYAWDYYPLGYLAVVSR